MNRILLAYMRETEIPEEMLWKKSAESQMCFVRDTICFSLLHVPCFMISKHRSKSIDLPVYGFMMKNGVKVIARNNFYDWTISVELPESLPENYLKSDMFTHRMEEDATLFFQGFKDEWIYDIWLPKKQNLKKFSCEVRDDYYFFLLMYKLKNAFPEIDYSQKKTPSKKEIVKILDEIYSDNGVYTMIENYNIRTDSQPVIESLISSYEPLWWTHNKLSDYLREKYQKYTTEHIEDRIEEYAQYILESPDIMKVFLSESECFKTKF